MSTFVDRRRWAVDGADAVRDTIQTKPFLAVGLVLFGGVAVGFALGWASSRGRTG